MEDGDAGLLIKNGCEITLHGKEHKSQDMLNAQYKKKNKLVMMNLYLILDDLIFFNIETEITAKGIWKKMKNFFEEKTLMNKIYLR